MKDVVRQVRFVESKRKYDTVAYKFQHVLRNDDGEPGLIVLLEQWDVAGNEQLGAGQYEVTIKKID